MVAEVLGGDYAVAPDKSIWWGHKEGTVLFAAQDDHLKVTIQWPPKASPLLGGALEFVANIWNQRDGVPTATVTILRFRLAYNRRLRGLRFFCRQR